MRNFWRETRVLVTGGAGFIGSHLVEELVKLGAEVRVADDLSRGAVPNLDDCIDSVELARVNLNDFDECVNVCKDIEMVFGLAARVAGIKFNQSHSADMFRLNSRLNLNMLEAARMRSVERYLVVSSACVYPRECSIPTPEFEGFHGDPDPTNWGYGWAKRFSEIQAMAYSSQYGMQIGIVRPYNTYGPRDHFFLEEAHVIPALIGRISQGVDPLIVWGSGRQTRSFVYVKDVVEGFLTALEKYPRPDPINIGSAEEIEISELVRLIAGKLKLAPRVVFDMTKPDGSTRRLPDNSKAMRLIRFQAKTPLSQGLDETILWLKEQAKTKSPQSLMS